MDSFQTSILEQSCTSKEILSVRIMIAIAQNVEQTLHKKLEDQGLQYDGPEIPLHPDTLTDIGNTIFFNLPVTH